MTALAASLARLRRRYPVKIAAYFTFFIVLAPLLAVIWVSFFENKIIGFPPTGYTLKWFANAWNFERFHRGFTLSVQVGLMATVASLLIGVPAALAARAQEIRRA